MAFITRKITRTSQPQELVGYDQDRLAALGVVGGAVVTSTSQHINGIAPGTVVTYSGFTAFPPISETGSNGLSFLLNQSSVNADFANIPTAAVYTQSFTFYARVRIDVGNNVHARLGASNILLWRNGTTFDMRLGGTDYVGAGTWNLGKWYDICITGNGKLYVDKTLVINSGSPAYQLMGTNLVFGDDILGGGAGGKSAWQYFVFCDRNHTLEEISAFTANPWQIFEPIEETIWIPDGVSVTLPTLVQPASTTSAGTWTPVGAATLHEAIDEVTPSDADYISVAAASNCEMVLAESAFPTGNVSLAYRALSSTGNTLTVTLKQGTTTIMTRTHALTGTATLYTQPLTAGEVAAIVAGPVTCTLTSS